MSPAGQKVVYNRPWTAYGLEAKPPVFVVRDLERGRELREMQPTVWLSRFISEVKAVPRRFNLAEKMGEVSGIEWTVNGVTGTGKKAASFRVLGTYLHSQYNTPRLSAQRDILQREGARRPHRLQPRHDGIPAQIGTWVVGIGY